MVRKVTVRDFFREIRKTKSRFVSVALLAVLAVAFFSGLRSTKPDMLLTADRYFDDSSMYDIEILSTLGITDADVEAVSERDGVLSAEGTYQMDAIVSGQDEDLVIRIMTDSQSGMNQTELLSGRMVEAPDECVVEERLLELTGLSVGDRFPIEKLQEGFEDALQADALTIVGVVRTPLYLNKILRENSTMGSGNVSSFIVVMKSAVQMDAYTGMYVLVDDAPAVQTYSDAYDDIVAPVMDDLEFLAAEREEIRTDEIVGDAEVILNEHKEGLRRAKDDLADAQEAADAELGEAAAELEKARQEIADGYDALQASEDRLEQEKTDGYAQIMSALGELDSAQAELDRAYGAYEDSYTRYEERLAAWNALTDEEKQAMPELAAELEATGAELEATKAQLDQQQAALDAGYEEADGKLAALESETAAAEREIDAGYAQLEEAEAELKDGEAEYEQAKQEAEAKIADAEAEIAKAEAEIADAEAEIAAVRPAEWYVLGRDSNAGYADYREDADRIGALANIFPIIFFLVAILVSLTTMTRMVEEKRMEIGTLKALGYGKTTTTGKFVGYSAAATVTGALIGAAIGMRLMPWFIFQAYSIMYNLPDLETPVQVDTILLAAGAALVCTVGATVGACTATLRETPASLLRPKAPKAGKRVFLERVRPVWKRMSFFGKVSVRNLFRYKKRFIMTIVGIAGCTALIVTGFGLRDSIRDITSMQFDQIETFDLRAYLNHDATKDEKNALLEALENDPLIRDYLYIDSEAVDFKSDTASQGGYLIVPEDPGRLEDFISLRHRTDDAGIRLPDDGVVMTEKLAELLNLHVGDTFTIDSDGTVSARVADITENYIHHYIYMTPVYYEKVFGNSWDANVVLLDGADDTQQTSDAVSASLLNLNAVSYVPDFSVLISKIEQSMDSVDNVVLIILGGAALLAFVVLYNLMNINITERTRELATIKVLGFYDLEVSHYIVRENTTLTVIGIAFGLVGGKFMHQWLVRTVEIDMAMFVREVRPASYVLAAALTLLFAVMVHLIGHYQMRKISMVASLKTNE